METTMSEFADWINAQLLERGWSGNELARRAGVSSAGFHQVMTDTHGPGLNFCLGVAQALGERPERVLRLAGLLPPIAPEVAEEEQACRVLRELSPGGRVLALELLRTLSSAARGSGYTVGEGRAPYRTGRPRSASEWIRQEVDRLLAGMELADQERVLRYVQRTQEGGDGGEDAG